jgi:phosphoribosyl 1,2-cyclic phosphodiesterase
MRLIALQSGSNGNCVYVEANSVRLLVDAGISGIQAQRRLSQFGRDIHDVDGLLLSHDHADHTRCAGIYQRKFGMPIHVTERTLSAGRRYRDWGSLSDVRHFTSGEVIDFGGVVVETIRTPHDGADGVAFVIDDGETRIGVLTDLGHVFDELGDVIASLDGVLLESNYDPHLLAHGPYPSYLKRRIRGSGGHLSNQEAAALLDECAGPRLQWVCLGHLSGENNEPDLALAAAREILGDRFELHVASRQGPVGEFETVSAMKAVTE